MNCMKWKVDKKKSIMLIYTRTLLISFFVFISVYILGQVTNALGKDDMLPLIFILLLVWLKVVLSSYVYDIELKDDTFCLLKTNLLGITQNISINYSNLALKTDKQKELKGTSELLRLLFLDSKVVKGSITENIFGWKRNDIISIQQEVNNHYVNKGGPQLFKMFRRAS